MKPSLADFPEPYDSYDAVETRKWKRKFEAKLRALREKYRRKAMGAMKAHDDIDAVQYDQRAWMITQVLGDVVAEPPKDTKTEQKQIILPENIKEKLEQGRTICLSCGYSGEDIQGEYPDLWHGFGCPRCQSPLVVLEEKPPKEETKE